VVLHINHAQEIDESVEAMCLQLRGCGALLLNQSVLLAQVNDSAEILCNLSLRLQQCGVLPYYLHQLDKVVGAAHFEVAPQRGKELVATVQTMLPGYLVPRYVRERAGRPGKDPIID
jgi:L-lysine 2,3-aminomutase